LPHERAGQDLSAGRRLGRALRGAPVVTVLIAALATGAAAIPVAAAASPAARQAPSVVLCSGYSACARLGDPNYGYATRSGTSYWRMTAGNECTNYVAFVESTVFRVPTPDYLLGNAGQWAVSAAAHGITVNHVPAVGAVAEWDGGSYGMGPEGHVAVVEAVGPRDSYIIISQQHIGSDVNGFDWTRINAGFPANSWQPWPSHFIHFAGAGPAPASYSGAPTGWLRRFS
jgi:surface antigen